jgi:hypothetical protein
MAEWNNDKPGEYEANQKERVRIFNLIAPVGNWKMPIDAWVNEADLRDVEQAAIFFTGGPVEVVARIPSRSAQQVHVRGLGYYRHIGA